MKIGIIHDHNRTPTRREDATVLGRLQWLPCAPRALRVAPRGALDRAFVIKRQRRESSCRRDLPRKTAMSETRVKRLLTRPANSVRRNSYQATCDLGFRSAFPSCSRLTCLT